MVSSERRLGLTLAPVTALAPMRRSSDLPASAPASDATDFFALGAGIGASAFWVAAFDMG
ncbi:hypothetical protein D9M71_682020 [compost metagenome]